ncbi:MAG: HAD-IA family hydrolase [Acidimicrobiia bacterium]|nr:HAD-IA family hydrolase [Acidimicrobiia bacterium]
MTAPAIDVVVFDLDGTLVDSDRALDAAWLACGVPLDRITYGHVLAAECDRLGIAVDDYLAAYDPSLVVSFPGVEEMLADVGRWAICSNKHGSAGPAELAQLGWTPEVALFADAFVGSKELAPVLHALGITAEQALFVGDTLHDRHAADDAGCRFVWAGWNPRVGPTPGDEVAQEPAQILAAAGGQLLV